MSDDPDAASSSDASVSAPSPEDASGYGLTITLVGAVLLALGYYGVLALRGGRELGQAVPEPLYFLAIAALFAIELLRAGAFDVVALGRAIAFAVVFGGLFVLAAEGAAALWTDPDPALEGFAGLTVLAVALVASVLAYVGYLAVVEAESGAGS